MGVHPTNLRSTGDDGASKFMRTGDLNVEEADGFESLAPGEGQWKKPKNQVPFLEDQNLKNNNLK